MEIFLKLLITLLLSLNVSSISTPINASKTSLSPVTLIPIEERKADKVVPSFEYYNLKIADIEFNIQFHEGTISMYPDSEGVPIWQEGLEKLNQERDALIAERDKHYPPAP